MLYSSQPLSLSLSRFASGSGQAERRCVATSLTHVLPPKAQALQQIEPQNLPKLQTTCCVIVPTNWREPTDQNTPSTSAII